jgi:hypothetical protein
MHAPCFVCGETNLCCIPCFDEAGVLRQYCCRHVPRQMSELMGNPLGSGKKCPIENAMCCFSVTTLPKEKR